MTDKPTFNLKIQSHVLVFFGLVFILVTALLSLPKPVEAVNPVCNSISISLSPNQATYTAGQAVTIQVNGVSSSTGTPSLHWTRSTANTRLGGEVWTIIPGSWATSSRYQATWVIPNTLPGNAPYNQSFSQEFLIAFTLYNNGFVCSGNPDPGEVGGHPELPAALCSNCQKVVITKPIFSEINLENYWNIKSGYSFTYVGTRHDNPEDDIGKPVNGNFTTRMEYEVPIKLGLCDNVSLIPQRWTKSNQWGYWGPARPNKSERVGNIWTNGNRDLRFFLTTPEYSYPWNNGLFGAYGHKIYEINSGDNYELGNLTNNLNRTIIHTSRNHENYYYPPYMLSYAGVPSSGVGEFKRIDSLYHYLGQEAQNVICNQQIPTEDHYWYMRSQMLTDSALKNEFSPIANYFGGISSKNVVVITFFEALDGVVEFREDWYLMEGVGLVGVDQARWDRNAPDALTITNNYLNASFMKLGTPAEPDMRIRADRAYLGGSLKISPVGVYTSPTAPMTPASSWPLQVPQGGCYKIRVESVSSTGQTIPYDGYLQHNKGATPPTLWTSSLYTTPVWISDGYAKECLTSNFPIGLIEVYMGAFTQRLTNNPHETQLSFTEMPMPVDGSAQNQLRVNVISASP